MNNTKYQGRLCTLSTIEYFINIEIYMQIFELTLISLQNFGYMKIFSLF